MKVKHHCHVAGFKSAISAHMVCVLSLVFALWKVSERDSCVNALPVNFAILSIFYSLFYEFDFYVHTATVRPNAMLRNILHIKPAQSKQAVVWSMLLVEVMVKVL